MNWSLLEELTATPGAPGHEDRIRAVVRRELASLVDEMRVDPMGNLIGLKRRTSGDGEPRKLMLAAHLDEISFIVTHIEDNGFLRFVPLGGFDPKTLTAQRVLVHGTADPSSPPRDLLGVMGSKPVHILTDDERKAAPKLEAFFIDLGLPKEQVVSIVQIGDVVTRQRELVRIGDLVNGKSLDNRMGLYVMIEAVRALQGKGHELDLYPVATVQEEVGIRGAMVATRQVEPDLGIALDVTLANDVPGVDKHDWITALGAGAAIKLMDGTGIASPAVVSHLRRVAAERNIPVQMEILPKGGTDMAGLQRGGRGAAVGCISIPTRYVHSVIESCHVADIQAAVDLLAAFIETAHTADVIPV